MWLCVIFFTSIIFLNFIIAEACSSYQSVTDSLKAESYKAKALLVAEADNVMPDKIMND